MSFLTKYLTLAACLVLTAIACTAAIAASGPPTTPRTPDGHPDLQGLWSNSTITPLERPADLKDTPFFTDAEAAEYESHADERARARRGALEAKISPDLDEAWSDRGKVVPSRRTSLIVDPSNGRIPALTPEAQRRRDARAAERKEHPADGPEDLALNERCLFWGAGPPMAPMPYNHTVQIVQTPAYVMILSEMMHDARVIPLDGRPHLPPDVRQWAGDSRGRWEGDTLVVDTTNFTDKTSFNGASAALHVIERLSRVDADTLLYQYTVDDPASFTRPWSAEIPIKRTEGPLFEYACHEANYSMEGTLRGARAEEHDRKDR